MLGLCLIWGVQQVIIKLAAPDIAPVMQAAMRSGISALLVGLLICWKGGWSQVPAMAWGATTVVVRGSRLSEAPVTLTLFYQLIVGFLGLLVIAAFSGQISHVSLTTVAVASVLFQGLVVSFFSYLVWFWLLKRYMASNLAVFSFMTPLFGVTFGVLVLHEPLSINFVVGAVLVLCGITFVSAEQWVRRKVRALLGS